MSEKPSPTNWRQIEPEHAAAIDKAIDNLIGALERLAAAAGETLVEAAATGYVIDRLDGWLERDLRGVFSSQDSDDEVG